MNVEVKLFASLSRLLPPTDEGSVATLDVADGTTVARLLDRLRIPKEMAHLVLVNGVNIEGEHSRILEEGDTVCVFPPVTGGAPGGGYRVLGVGCRGGGRAIEGSTFKVQR